MQRRAPAGANRAILPPDLQVELLALDAQYEATRAPVGLVEKRIEKVRDELVRVRFEVAPLASVDEPCGRDRRPAGNRAIGGEPLLERS